MAHDNSSQHGAAPETRKMIRKWVIQAFIGWLGYGVILFGAAGRLDWLWGWLQWLLTGLVLAAHPILLVPINPELLAEREKGMRASGTEPWDRWLAPTAAGMFIVVWIIAALQVRFGWEGGFSTPVKALGLLLVVAGYAIFLWAMVSNAWFAEGVRIQTERGHQVASSGPYRFVRHPGYAGAVMGVLAMPFSLGSGWAIIPAAFAALLYVLRTSLEDRTLREKLPGYVEYSQKIRYRLLPGIW